MFGSAIAGKAYKIGVVFAILLIASATVLGAEFVSILLLMPREISITARRVTEFGSDPVHIIERIVAISPLIFSVSAIVTAVTVLFGWRAERRQTEDLKLRLRDLEFELARSRGDTRQ